MYLRQTSWSAVLDWSRERMDYDASVFRLRRASKSALSLNRMALCLGQSRLLSTPVLTQPSFPWASFDNSERVW